MFLDAGAEEIMVVAVVALIFVGPKDLPIVLRKVGQFTARMRGLAAEFRASFDEMARQSELDELKKEVEALRRGDPVKAVSKEIDSHFEMLHREMGASPPAGFGAREGEMLAGPGTPPPDLAPSHDVAQPEPFTVQPPAPAAASPAKEPAG